MSEEKDEVVIYKNTSEGGNMSVQKITNQADFDSAIKEGVCLIDFNAVWCGPCKAQEPIIKKLSGDFEGRAVIAEVDVDQNQETAVKFGIQSIPTLVLFKNGQEINRFIGLQSEEVLNKTIESVL
jgi:thioredoxin 1